MKTSGTILCYTYCNFLHITTQLPIHPATKRAIAVSNKPVDSHIVFPQPRTSLGPVGMMLVDGERVSVTVLGLLSVMLTGIVVVEDERVLAVFVVLSAGSCTEDMVTIDDSGGLLVGYTVSVVTDGMFKEQSLSLLRILSVHISSQEMVNVHCESGFNLGRLRSRSTLTVTLQLPGIPFPMCYVAIE